MIIINFPSPVSQKLDRTAAAKILLMCAFVLSAIPCLKALFIDHITFLHLLESETMF